MQGAEEYLQQRYSSNSLCNIHYINRSNSLHNRQWQYELFALNAIDKLKLCDIILS